MKGPDPALILTHTGRSLFGDTYPEDYQPILISSVLSLASAAELHEALTKADPVFDRSPNTVDRWLVAVRKWLGFKGKNRKDVKAELPAWIAINGCPTIESIRNGWRPHHRRAAVLNPQPSSPASQAHPHSDPGYSDSKVVSGPVKPAITSLLSSTREDAMAETGGQHGEIQPNRTVEEIQEQIRSVSIADKKAWEEKVFRLKCELFTATNPHPPDKGDMNDLRIALPGMWRDARKRHKAKV